MLAIVGMVATSCQQEVDLGVKASGELAEVSLNVQAPAIANRAYSDGLTATVLQYAVYNAAGQELEELTVTDGDITGGSATVQLQLVTGNSYSVVFWAAAPNSPYTVDFAEKTMTVDYSNVACNNESLDAFYKRYDFTVSGAQTETIELRRPFAQLNIGTNDYVEAAKAGFVPTTSTVTVKQLSNVLNLWDGTVSGTPADVTFTEAAFDKTQTFPVSGYDYLAMNYLLVGAESETVEVVFTYASGADSKSRTVGSVPVQRNHRTNLYGAIITSLVDFNVEIKPEYDEPAHDVEVPALVAVNNTQALKEALVAGASNVVVAAGEYTFPASSLQDGVTIVGSEGTVMNVAGSTISANNVTIKGVVFQNDGRASSVLNITGKNPVIEDCVFLGAAGNGSGVIVTSRSADNVITLKNCDFSQDDFFKPVFDGWSGLNGATLVIDGCKLANGLYAMHIDGNLQSGTVLVKNSYVAGFVTNAETLDLVSFENCTFGVANGYACVNIYTNHSFVNCTFPTKADANNTNNYGLYVGGQAAGKNLTIKNCRMSDGTAMTLANADVANGGFLHLDSDAEATVLTIE